MSNFERPQSILKLEFYLANFVDFTITNQK